MRAVTTPSPEVCVFDDAEELFTAVADRFVEACRTDVAVHDAFHVALAGGSTPRQLYYRLSEAVRADAIPWENVHIYFGDERCVASQHPDSNYGMARGALLDPVPVPAGHVHRMEGERDPRQAAEAYGRMLREQLPAGEDGAPVFDLVLLGLGGDGHVASLFPGTEALEATDPATAVYVDKLESWRLSLTLPVLNAARRVWLLATGAEKADIIQTALDEPQNPPLPVQRLEPKGEWTWFLDSAAAPSPEPVAESSEDR